MLIGYYDWRYDYIILAEYLQLSRLTSCNRKQLLKLRLFIEHSLALSLNLTIVMKISNLIHDKLSRSRIFSQKEVCQHAPQSLRFLLFLLINFYLRLLHMAHLLIQARFNLHLKEKHLHLHLPLGVHLSLFLTETLQHLINEVLLVEHLFVLFIGISFAIHIITIIPYELCCVAKVVIWFVKVFKFFRYPTTTRHRGELSQDALQAMIRKRVKIGVDLVDKGLIESNWLCVTLLLVLLFGSLNCLN